MKKERLLLISCLLLALCIGIIIGIIIGVSLSNQTNPFSAVHHLNSGTLDITMKRTSLEYRIPGDDGHMQVINVSDELDFTESTANNVFGLDSDDILIVPGSYFEAEMELTNDTQTAVAYSVMVYLNGEPNELAKQLRVIVTRFDGITEQRMLSEFGTGMPIQLGEIAVGVDAQSFRVRVEFLNDVVYNAGLPEGTPKEDRMNNNAAQSQTISFDLAVTATRAS